MASASLQLLRCVLVSLTPHFHYTTGPNFTSLHHPFVCAALQEMRDWHRPRIRCLVEEGVDVLAIETIAAKVNEGSARLYYSITQCSYYTY